MLQHPQWNPVALQAGPLAIHWYGLMYLLAFAFVWLLGRYRIRQGLIPLTQRHLEDLLFYGVLGVIVGGRVGYALFYKFGDFSARPWELLYLWQGGMSFHGGLLGVFVALWLCARKTGQPFLVVSDAIAPLVPLGLAAGRMGNFINGELWGRPTDLPWGMVFPQAGDGLARHPSQLYEMGLEGLALFAMLWWFSRRPRPAGQISALFLTGYGVLRFLVEYTREPDRFLGVLSGGMTMGQWLSLPMILIGVILAVRAAKQNPPHVPSRPAS